MKLNKADFLRKSQFPLLLACATYPIAAMLTAAVAQEALASVLALSSVYAVLAMVCLVLPGRVRLVAGGVGCTVLVGLGAALLPWRGSVVVLLLPVGYGALLMLGLSMAAWPRERELHGGWIAVGLAAHVVAQIILHTIGAGQGSNQVPAGLMTVAPELFGTFVMFLGLAMLCANRVSIGSASMGRQRVPASMRRWNTLLTLGLLALVLLLAAAPGIARALRALWEGLKAAIRAAFHLLFALIPKGGETPPEPDGAVPSMFGMMDEMAEPAAWVTAVERVAQAVVLLMLAVGAWRLLRLIYRRARVLLRRLIERLGRFAAAAGEDYIDEVTDTRRETGGERTALRRRFRQRIDWGQGNLPPRERIRHRYLRLKRKHPEWQASLTAREALPGDPAELYERARYSDHEITEAEARAFEEGVRKI